MGEREEQQLFVLEQRIAEHIPGFAVKYKDQSKTQKLIKALMFWANYDDFITTFTPVVWWPSEKGYRRDTRDSFSFLAHEYVHLRDGRNGATGWFGFSYVLPQILGVFGLLMFLGFAWKWLWFLAALFIFVVPWPAYWRMKWELRGYSMTMAVEIWKTGKLHPSSYARVLSVFTGWGYYKMWWSVKGMNKRLRATEQAIHNGDILTWSPAFIHVKQVLDMDDVDLARVSGRAPARVNRVNT